MSTLAYLCLLLAAFSTSVSSETTSSLASSTVFNNCSGDYPLPLPSGAASTPDSKPQISVNKTGTGWEEWLVLAQGSLTDGSNITYGYRWSLGDPASANLSDTTFSAWVYFLNGTFYNGRVHDAFKYEENTDGGFTCSIADNHLTWDPVDGSWQVSVNAEGLVTETHIEVVEPGVPFAPNYKSLSGQISDGLFSRMDVPRGHMTGNMTFPDGLNVTTNRGIGILKHSWSHKPMADTLSAYVRGTGIIAEPVTTVNWYQVWDISGKEIDSMQLLQPGDSPESQVFRIQITDSPEVLSIITTPVPASLPLAYNSTEVALPLCGPGVDFEKTDQKTTWKMNNLHNLFEFVDSAGGTTMYQMTDATTVAWVNGTLQEFTNGVGFVEVYLRG